MARVFLRDCIPGDLIDDVYVVTGKQLSATSTGKHFIKVFVSDRSMQVTSRIWNATREMFNAMPDSGFLQAARRGGKLPEQSPGHHRADVAGQGGDL